MLGLSQHGFTRQEVRPTLGNCSEAGPRKNGSVSCTAPSYAEDLLALIVHRRGHGSKTLCKEGA